MFIANDINQKSNLGFVKYIPDINWSNLCTNANNILNKNTAEEDISIIEKYLEYSMYRPSIRNRSRIYVDYMYLTKFTFSEDVLNNITALTNDMLENGNCAGRHGHDRLASTNPWTQITPTIINSTNRDLRLSIYECMRQRKYQFIYCNTGIPNILLKFYETVSGESDCHIKLDDNTHIISCDANSSKVCLFSDEYTKETLTKHILRIFDIPESEYHENFCTDIVTQVNSDELDKQIKEFMTESALSDNIQRLLKYDTDIEETLSRYNSLLNNRLSHIKQLQTTICDSKTIISFVNTIKKMGDDFSVEFIKGGLFAKPFLRVKCTTPLFNYDEGVIKRMINNGTLEQYTKSSNSWVNKLFEDCFVKNTRQFMTETYIKLYISPISFVRDDRYNDVSLYSYDEIITRCTSQQTKYIGNPHIIRFNCWGQNGPVLERLTTDKKWEEMLYCLKATLGNINFNDPTVLKWFCYVIKSAPDNYPICRDTETGKDITVKELKDEWSKQNEEN